MGVVDRLAEHPLFAGFDRDDLDALCQAAEVRTFEVGETIIRCGEPGTHLGVVLSGRVEAVGADERGRPRRFAELGEMDYFGEISLISGEPTTADVKAVIPSQVLLIPHGVLFEALQSNPQALQLLARTVSQRLRNQIAVRIAPADSGREVKAPAGAASEGSSTAAARVLVIDCSPSALRYSYFDVEREFHNRAGCLDGIGTACARHVHGTLRTRTEMAVEPTLPAAVQAILDSLADAAGPLDSVQQLSIVAHRIAHGGEEHHGPAVIDEGVLAGLNHLGARAGGLDPSLRAIDVCRRAVPDAQHVAVFDTAFFQNMPPAAFMYPIPYDLYRQDGIRRYGCHGLAHHQAALLAQDHLDRPLDELRLVTCWIDDTSSVCAVGAGRALDVSCGLAPGSGLPGATWAGDIDPNVVWRIAKARGLSLDEARAFFTEGVGLFALSGTSGDVGELAQAADAGDERAGLALDVWAHAFRKCIGAHVAVLGGLDALVFTGRHGETNPALRDRVCQGLEGLGLSLDPRLNHSPDAYSNAAGDVAEPRSSARILLVSTDEPRMVASEALGAIGRPELAALLRARRRPIPIGISAHHVHLSPEHVAALFGPGHQLTVRAELTQPGQFACEEAVTLVGPRGTVDRVRVLGPVRPQTQVEISRTEEFKLGIDAPLRASGDLEGSPGLRLEGPHGALDLQCGVICAARHVHMSPEDALRFRVRDRDSISVRVEGARGISFRDVLVRVHPDFRLDMHVDTDEANAAELDRDAVGYMEAIERGR